MVGSSNGSPGGTGSAPAGSPAALGPGGARKRASTPVGAPSKDASATSDAKKEVGKEAAKTNKGPAQLAFCFIGLQMSYLTWGYMQEKVMTKEYGVGSSASKFPSAIFCVFSNRVLAIVMAASIILYRQGRLGISAPLTAFAPCSFSNSVSSFAQYSALHHVTFPLQTLSKSTKVVLVLLMGKVLNGKTNPWSSYIEAFVISLGVSIFAFSSGKGASGAEFAITTPDGNATTGLFMLALYLASDSFTSQWQSRVYKQHNKVDQYQMMFATNMWSIAYTLFALVASGELVLSLAFLAEHPQALVDNALIALTSATGQIFIFHTIKTFGPVAFTIMMTTRQVFSMVISAMAFNHNLTAHAWIGVALVFGTAFYRVMPKKKEEKKN